MGGKDPTKVDRSAAYICRQKIHTVVISTQHAEPLKATRCKEVAGYTGPDATAPSMEEMNKLIVEEVVKKTLAEITLKSGAPAPWCSSRTPSASQSPCLCSWRRTGQSRVSSPQTILRTWSRSPLIAGQGPSRSRWPCVNR